MAETITPTPLRVSNSATKPILRMFVSLSSREKPRPLERLVRTMSPSRTSTLPNLCLSSFSTISLIVVLPAPESPVNHSVKPRPCLLPFSTTPSSCLFFRLLLKGAGQSDQSFRVPQALDELLHQFRVRNLEDGSPICSRFANQPRPPRTRAWRRWSSAVPPTLIFGRAYSIDAAQQVIHRPIGTNRPPLTSKQIRSSELLMTAGEGVLIHTLLACWR